MRRERFSPPPIRLGTFRSPSPYGEIRLLWELARMLWLKLIPSQPPRITGH